MIVAWRVLNTEYPASRTPYPGTLSFRNIRLNLERFRSVVILKITNPQSVALAAARRPRNVRPKTCEHAWPT
jgi:hypothetical protein